MNLSCKELLYSGKAKSLYATEDANTLICEFRDDTSAFDGVKVEKLANKGMVNNKFNAFIMQHLKNHGIDNHFIELISDTKSLVKKLKMLPIECVIRNYAAGGLCKRLGIEKGKKLNPPTFEFFLKNDALHDPMINESYILTFGWATQAEVNAMRDLTFKVNEILTKLFLDANLLLVDYKLEFGTFDGKIILGDEFSPDGCRIWDKDTKEVFDKDRFRQDLGNVVESYSEVANRIGVKI